VKAEEPWKASAVASLRGQTGKGQLAVFQRCLGSAFEIRTTPARQHDSSAEQGTGAAGSANGSGEGCALKDPVPAVSGEGGLHPPEQAPADAVPLLLGSVGA